MNINDAAKLVEQMKEPLHPELLPYVEDGSLGLMLRHPLVYQVPLFDNHFANQLLLQKQNQLAEAVASDAFSQIVFLHERAFRLEAFTAIANLMDDMTYWQLLAAIWTDTENQWAYRQEWIDLLTSRTNAFLMMSREDLDTFNSLPEQIQIHRGFEPGVNEDGLSWTLDITRAEFFAKRFKKTGEVKTITINKSDAIAYLNTRNEAEIIHIKGESK